MRMARLRPRPEFPSFMQARTACNGHLFKDVARAFGRRPRPSPAPRWHRPASASPEIGNAYCLFQDHPGIIVGIGPGRLTVVQNARVRPIGYARATLTALLIAHDVSPLCAVHVAMAIGERRVGGIGVPIVSRT